MRGRNRLPNAPVRDVFRAPQPCRPLCCHDIKKDLIFPGATAAIRLPSQEAGLADAKGPDEGLAAKHAAQLHGSPVGRRVCGRLPDCAGLDRWLQPMGEVLEEEHLNRVNAVEGHRPPATAMAALGAEKNFFRNRPLSKNARHLRTPFCVSEHEPSLAPQATSDRLVCTKKANLPMWN